MSQKFLFATCVKKYKKYNLENNMEGDTEDSTVELKAPIPNTEKSS